MFVNKQKIKINKDVVFMKDNESIRFNLEMSPSGRNKCPTVMVAVDESSKSMCIRDQSVFHPCRM